MDGWRRGKLEYGWGWIDGWIDGWVGWMDGSVDRVPYEKKNQARQLERFSLDSFLFEMVDFSTFGICKVLISDTLYI